MGTYHTGNERETLSVLMAVCCHDKADYLHRAMSSIWNDQSLRPEQIILVEDGPLGFVLQTVVSRWKAVLGDHLCICRNEKNEGLTKCLNIGLRHVRTTFVARMDSDDVSAPGRFERQLRYLQRHPEVDILGGAIQEFNDDCECLSVRHYPLTHEEAVRYLSRACPLSHPAVMMRMRIFHAGLTYDERFPTSQDIALWFDAVNRGFRMANLNDIVVYYRRDDSFYRRRSKAKARRECMIYLRGIYRTKGLFTLLYMYPLARFCFRLFPLHLVRMVYNSRIRDYILSFM